MPFYNRIYLMGNLTKDVELRYTPQGSPVARFCIAVNRSFKDSQGNWKKADTLFINIVAWGGLAERCAEVLGKGSNVFVEGRLDIRNYEWQGEKRKTTEVFANKVIPIPRKGEVKEVSEEPEVVEEVVDELPPGDDTPSGDDIPF